MLRSFDYAADHLLAGQDPDNEEMIARARSWVAHNQHCFAAGHEAGGGVDDPFELEGFLLDKAVYEVVYESRHRPDRVGGPLAAIGRMLATPSGTLAGAGHCCDVEPDTHREPAAEQRWVDEGGPVGANTGGAPER
jgi:hypothetical protein